MEVIRNDELVRIEVDHAQNTVISTWTGYVPSDDYREALWQVLDQIKLNHLGLWLCDTRAMGAILRSDEKWSVETFVPELMKYGLRRVAVVQSLDYFNRTTTERMASATREVAPFKVEFFPSPEEARHWLLKEQEAFV